MSGAKCAGCNWKNEPGAATCRNCGAPLPPTASGASHQTPDSEAKRAEARRAREGAERAAREAERVTQERARAAAERARVEALRRQWEYKLRAFALTCTRCGKLALPIPATPDRYGCPDCNHQFIGGRHDVPLPPA